MLPGISWNMGLGYRHSDSEAQRIDHLSPWASVGRYSL